MSSLPQLNSWENYKDSEKISSFAKVGDTEFLCNYEFGDAMRHRNTSEFKDFCMQCRRLIDRFIDVILSQLLVSSEFLQGVYCFCPELLLGGDDLCVFNLFSKLVREFERSGVVFSTQSKSAVEKFALYVVHVRARHLSSGGHQSEEISDVVTYHLSDFGFLGRKKLCRVFKLCLLLARRPLPQYPQVEVDLDGCAVPAIVIKSCVRGIQSYVSACNYKPGAFFY